MNLFFDKNYSEFVNLEETVKSDEFVSIEISEKTNSFYLIIEARVNEYVIVKEEFKFIDSEDRIVAKRNLKRSMKRNIYKALQKKYSSKSKWGILVGIRPVKLYHELYQNCLSEEEIKNTLLEEYLMAEEKADLIISIGQRESKYIYPLDGKNISIYLCIPFCPTRCLYCSFPSNDMKQKGKLMNKYLDSLMDEIKAVMPKVIEKGLNVENLYIGGGTPTSLTREQFGKIFDLLKKYIDLNKLKEFTVEAGRPDTIDKEKLLVLKNYGVNRICINPQTMKDETLIKIGRNHNSNDIIESYKLIQSVGFQRVNCDLILGLIDEQLSDVKNTLEIITSMKPENITVHTLAVKRSSRLNEKITDYNLSEGEDVENMMEYSKEYLLENGYFPYYLYRQKNMLGNLENIGFCKDGFESTYNIQIMEEMQTIIGFGAGATSKIISKDRDRFDNIPNIKGLEEYIERVQDNIDKKLNYLNSLT